MSVVDYAGLSSTNGPEPDSPTDAGPPDAPSREEALGMARDWLRADPKLSFGRARRDAARMKLALTSRLYSEARRSLGITSGPPRPPVRKIVEREVAVSMNDAAKRTSPLTSFVVEFLRGRPEATYADVKSAAASKGLKLAPIIFGRARKELGMAPTAKTAARTKPFAAAPAARGRPPRSSSPTTSSLGGDLGAMLGRLQTIAADRDRFHAALEEIARVIRNVL